MARIDVAPVKLFVAATSRRSLCLVLSTAERVWCKEWKKYSIIRMKNAHDSTDELIK